MCILSKKFEKLKCCNIVYIVTNTTAEQITINRHTLALLKNAAVKRLVYNLLMLELTSQNEIKQKNC